MRTEPLPVMKMSFVAALTKSGLSSSSYSIKSSVENVRCIDAPESSIHATILVDFTLKLHMGQLICEAVQLQENLFKAFKSPLVIFGAQAAHTRGFAFPSVFVSLFSTFPFLFLFPLCLPIYPPSFSP